MENHEIYVSYETALLLKQAGFNWKCQKYYGQGVMFEMESDEIRAQVQQYAAYDIPAPTLSVAQAWLREVKGVEVQVTWGVGYSEETLEWKKWEERTYDVEIAGADVYIWDIENQKTYEAALEAGINAYLKQILDVSKESCRDFLKRRAKELSKLKDGYVSGSKCVSIICLSYLDAILSSFTEKELDNWDNLGPLPNGSIMMSYHDEKRGILSSVNIAEAGLSCFISDCKKPGFDTINEIITGPDDAVRFFKDILKKISEL